MNETVSASCRLELKGADSNKEPLFIWSILKIYFIYLFLLTEEKMLDLKDITDQTCFR